MRSWGDALLAGVIVGYAVGIWKLLWTLYKNEGRKRKEKEQEWVANRERFELIMEKLDALTGRRDKNNK